MGKPSTLDQLAALAPSDPVMAGAWASCMRWAIGEPEALAEFRAATGNTFEPGKDALSRAIDQTTGAEAAFVLAFATWFTETVWGGLERDDDE